jgi:putative transposase
MLKHSARLWNAANYDRRQVEFKKMAVPRSYSAQCKKFKNNEHFVALGTGKGQGILQKLRDAWMSYRELKRMEREGRLPANIKKVRPPNYWKDHDGGLEPKAIVARSDCWRFDETGITVAKGLKIPYASGQLWVGKKGRLEIQYDSLSNRWYAHIPISVESPVSPGFERKAAVDIGVCNLVALAIEGVPRKSIWSGRAVLSDWRYWTKRIADKQSGLKQTNGKNRSRELSRLYRVRKRRLDHAINAMLRHLFDILEENDVGLLKIGDLTGIREDANHGDNGNQKLHNFWPFAQILRRICELAEEYGIAVEMVDERGSSKTCVMHPSEQSGRIHRGLYRCRARCVVYNADAGGAVNILYGNGKVAADGTQQANSVSLSGSGLLAQPLLFRWDYQKWGQALGTRIPHA